MTWVSVLRRPKEDQMREDCAVSFFSLFSLFTNFWRTVPPGIAGHTPLDCCSIYQAYCWHRLEGKLRATRSSYLGSQLHLHSSFLSLKGFKGESWGWRNDLWCFCWLATIRDWFSTIIVKQQQATSPVWLASYRKLSLPAYITIKSQP